MSSPSHKQLLGGRSPDEFLEQYWQNEPLVIREAFPAFQPPISVNEVAGLACEPGVESRLVLERDGEYPWQQLEGPFEVETLTQLPDSHWMLLVHQVEALVPTLTSILDHFSFIPRWRMDDLMITIGAPAGTVGPHIDNYDVFLLQAKGQKRWEISRTPIPPGEETWASHTDVRMLNSFTADESWVLEPGDLLYLPPRIPHHGTSIDQSMTFSIGFRTPSFQDLAAALLEEIDRTDHPGHRYSDTDLKPTREPGKIRAEDLQRAKKQLTDVIEEIPLARWFGTTITFPQREQYKYPPEEPYSADELRQQIASGRTLYRNPATRWAYASEDNHILLFVNGESYSLSSTQVDLAPLLCNHSTYPPQQLQPLLKDDACVELLVELINQGDLYIDEERTE